MNLVRYPAVSAGLVCVLVAAVLYRGRPSGGFFASGGPVMDPWHGQEDESLVRASADPDALVIAANIEAKDAIVRDLIAGRLSFAEAIAQFRVVDARRPPHLSIHLPDEQSDSPKACYGKQVVGYAKALLRDQPDGEAALVRLEAGLREYLAVPANRPVSAD